MGCIVGLGEIYLEILKFKIEVRFKKVDVHQGDPLAGVLFALVFHPAVILAIIAAVPSLALHTSRLVSRRGKRCGHCRRA